jgi:hypothetical protein
MTSRPCGRRSRRSSPKRAEGSQGEDRDLWENARRSEKPKDKKAEPAKDDPNKALKDAAKDLQKKLTEMEKRLWISPDVKGIVDDRTLMASVNAASNPVLSTFEPPSPTARTYLEQTEAKARKTFADFNKLFAEDVAKFRRKVGEPKIELLKEQEAISIAVTASE